MNVINMFVAFLASIIGIILAMVYAPIMQPLIAVMTTAGSANYYIATIGYLTMVVLMAVIIPIIIAVSDDSAIKKLESLAG